MITSRLSASAALFAFVATSAILSAATLVQHSANETAARTEAPAAVVAQLPRVEVVGQRSTTAN